MSDLTLIPIDHPFRATLSPPGSKSLTNRALILAALADGVSELSNVLLADDTLVMLDGLQKLGFGITRQENSVTVTGRGGQIESKSADLFCGNSGTTIRFLAALCAIGKGTYTLDGVARMRQRPIHELATLLRNLGTRVEFLENEGHPPVRITASGLAGGILKYGAAASSQFLSAVLMVSPHARHEVRVDLEGVQTSWPYVAMTMRLMDQFGHTPELLRDPNTGDPRQIIISRGSYAATKYPVEPDASNAAYFLAAASVHPGASVTIADLGKSSLQGDVGFSAILASMGARLALDKNSVTVTGTDRLDGIDVDLLSMPDQAQTLAVVALFARGRTIIRGLHTLRLKETDRLAALSTELRKFGATVAIEDNALLIDPPSKMTSATVATYDDHRMAMSFAVVGTKILGVTIADAQCVNKTYPRFFEDLELLRAAQIK
jgi:3-phosphoshikimate 1-carboxyvinyltransferase